MGTAEALSVTGGLQEKFGNGAEHLSQHVQLSTIPNLLDMWGRVYKNLPQDAWRQLMADKPFDLGMHWSDESKDVARPERFVYGEQIWVNEVPCSRWLATQAPHFMPEANHLISPCYSLVRDVWERRWGVLRPMENWRLVFLAEGQECPTSQVLEQVVEVHPQIVLVCLKAYAL